ncbi:MAG: hypothetical protein ACRDMV_01045 [Streptosporangiales bacterium]
MTETTIQGCLDALVAAFRTALPDSDVIDGPILQPPSTSDVLTVGYDEDEDTRSVQTERIIAGLNSEQESYDIACVASSWSGGTDVKPVRDSAAGMYSTVVQTLNTDPSVNGAVTRARVSFNTLDQVQAEGGCGVSVRFTIHVDAFVA